MIKFEAYIGDLFSKSVTFNYPSFDFTGCKINCWLKRFPSDVKPAYKFVIQPDFSVLGEATFTLTISGSRTARFQEGLYYADFEISRTDPPFGPYTPASFQIYFFRTITNE